MHYTLQASVFLGVHGRYNAPNSSSRLTITFQTVQKLVANKIQVSQATGDNSEQNIFSFFSHSILAILPFSICLAHDWQMILFY